MYVVHRNTLSDSFRIRIVWFQQKQDSDRMRISFFKNRIGSDSENPLSDHLWLVVMTHQVQCSILTLEAVLRKNMHLFLERCRRSNNVTVACVGAVRLFIFFLILSRLQPHFTLRLSDRTLQCFFVWGCACHNAFALYMGVTSLGISVPLCSSAVPSEQTVLRNVNLRLGLQHSYKTFCQVSLCSPVSSEISDLCEIFDLILFVSYFASQSKGIKFGDYFFDVCCANLVRFLVRCQMPTTSYSTGLSKTSEKCWSQS